MFRCIATCPAADSLRVPPELATKSFTSKNADEEMVNRLFEEDNKRMGGVTELKYAGWIGRIRRRWR